MTPSKTVERCREILSTFFGGDQEVVEWWFGAKSPLLGGVSPNDMISMGREAKLLEFVEGAVEAERVYKEARERIEGDRRRKAARLAIKEYEAIYGEITEEEMAEARMRWNLED